MIPFSRIPAHARRAAALAAAFVLCFLLAGCAGQDKQITSVDELDGRPVAVQTGTISDTVVAEKFPNSKVRYYSTGSDCAAAVINGKADYFIDNASSISQVTRQVEGLMALDESVYTQQYGAIFADGDKGSQLRSEFNDFVVQATEDGTIEEMRNRWYGSIDTATMPDIALTGENGTVNVAVSGDSMPFSCVVNNQLVGFDVELVKRFCAAKGYQVALSSMTWDALIPAVTSGKADMAISCITITEERAKSVNFSNPYLEDGLRPLVRDTSKMGSSGLVDALRKTFVDEARWKLMLNGVLVTLTISLIAILAGTLLGFGIYLLCRRGNRVANGIFGALAALFGGLPAVVLLMIFYYILLKGVPLSGTFISAIVFTLSMSLSVYKLLKTAVKSIGQGQTEGAYSLGFSDRQSFFRIVLPQAMTQFIPNYVNTAVNLVLSTAIVGYIAVQDLTRASDIIRGRTYEAFVPLFSSAIVYLLLGWLMALIIRRVGRLFEPRRRSDAKVLARFGVTPEQHEERLGQDNSLAGFAPDQAQTEIRIEQLRKAYPNVVPIANLSVTVNEGDVVAVIGPSGTGKSTLLRMVNMLEAPTSGRIFVDGEEVTAPGYPLPKLRAKVGMVFQQFNLFDHLSVIENVCFAPMQLQGLDAASAYKQGMELLGAVGLAPFALSYPGNLSGGQKQRAAIARTLATHPQVILFDEPTSALDPTMVGQVAAVVHNLASCGYTIMMVTHDMEFAEKCANRVFYLDEGGLYEDGTPEQVFHNPQRQKTRAFVKRMKEFSCEVGPQAADYPEVFAKLNLFLLHAEVPQDLAQRIKDVFMRSCVELLAPTAKSGSESFQCAVSYSARDKNAQISITSADVSFDANYHLKPESKQAQAWAAVEPQISSYEVEEHRITFTLD